MTNVIDFEEAREAKRLADPSFADYVQQIINILHESIQGASCDIAWDCWIYGASPGEAAEEIQGWW